MTFQPNVEDLLASIRKAIDRQDGDVERRLPERRLDAASRRPLKDDVPVRDYWSEVRSGKDWFRDSSPEDASPAPLALRRTQTEVFEEPAMPVDYGTAYRPETDPEPEAMEQSETEHPWSPDSPPALALPATTSASPGLLSPQASNTANAAFSQLADTLMSRATGERSIEELTQELLRSMLKEWLDTNLPGMVERLVREEIERVARRGGRR
ncbi:hypothetical protein BH10PSE7_BH10PSE7_42750 [soil metagenome]